jgi:serine/threonine-protein phosphatase 2A regulatory subunit B''
MIVDRIFDAAPRPFVESGPWTGAEEGAEGAAEGAAEAAAEKDPASPPLSPASAEVSDAPDNDGGEDKTKSSTNREFLSYEDFIFFMLSEEDKANEISIRYWFSCIDVDGDGRLNNMEMRSFYAVQLHRMQCMGHEVVPFEDMLCQMIDMIKPGCNDYLIPEDFLKPECAQVSGALFDALFNLNKYLMFEQRDPFMERQKREDEFDTDWDRFACIDYNRLAMEEEAREEEAMEIDWVTVDDEDEDGDEFNSLSSEAPF